MSKTFKAFIDNAINQLKENYEIPPEHEKAFRQCYELQFQLARERKENGVNEYNQQMMDQTINDMVKLLAGCSLKMALPKGSEIVFNENGKVDFIKLSN